MRTHNARSGFTLIEIMVVMMIIGLLAALVGPNLIGSAGKAEVQSAHIQIENLGAALDTFRLDVGRYPTTQEGLAALRQHGCCLDIPERGPRACTTLRSTPMPRRSCSTCPATESSRRLLPAATSPDG